MPKPSRVSEAPQRPSQALRRPRHLRTSSSDSDPLHQRPITDCSPKIRGVGDHQSPRSTQSEPLGQKKLGTRITDLETQLTQAQHELKNLKQQLASTKAVKKQAQEELHKKNSKRSTTIRRVQGREMQPPFAAEIQARDSREKPDVEFPEDIHQETDVFEVQVEKKLLVEPRAELSQCSVDDGKEVKLIDTLTSETENPSFNREIPSKREDIDQLKAKVEEKDKKLQAVIEENETLKQQLEEAKSEIASANSKAEDMTSKMELLQQELEASKTNAACLENKILDVKTVKESLEAEMKKMKVQTEQWRKAADAAAAVLSGGAEMNSRMSDRCASMDKHFNGGVFDQTIPGFGGYLGSLDTGDDMDDGFGGGKKKGSGIRMLGDLWKKKGHK